MAGLLQVMRWLINRLPGMNLLKPGKCKRRLNALPSPALAATPLLELVLAVAVELWPTIEIIPVKSQAHAFGVYNAYQQPEKLGVDRWLALVAVRQPLSGSCLYSRLWHSHYRGFDRC